MKQIHQLAEDLQARLQQPLPGLEAQLEMAPPARGTGEIIVPPDAKKSAVLLLLYPIYDELHTVFIQRAEDGRVHSGQISFPGGRIEPQDKDPIDTALREAEEEVGLVRKSVKILGQLSDMYIPPSNFLVHPVVGVTDARPDFTPDSVEVARVLEFGVHRFTEPDVRGRRDIEQRTRWGHYRTNAPAFSIDQHIIWGATSMMLNELLWVMRDLEKIK